MMTTHKDSLVARIDARFGAGRGWTPPSGFPAATWETQAYHLVASDGNLNEADMRKLWEARKGRQALPVVLLAASDDPAKIRVAGPQSARPMRELPADLVLDLLDHCRSPQMRPREAASKMSREFARLEESVVPGLRVKDLLTPHFVKDRLRRSVDERRLSDAAAQVGRAASWRPLFESLGYSVERLPKRGYLLRRSNAPIAIVHPLQDSSMFSRLNDNGELPEGLALADCERNGAAWAILAAGSRLRLFQRQPPIGAATGQYIEIDLAELHPSHQFYLGLFAPDSLREGGWLAKWVEDARDFGEELRKGLEDRLIKDALPNIARGLGAYLEAHGADLTDRDRLREIEEAALTLVFRFMFLLHTEARGYLPIASAAYRPHSAAKLAEDCRRDLPMLDRRSTVKWDSLRTLVRMVRTGNPAAGVPAYNGSLFAASGFPGSSLLEKAEIADTYLGPALTAIAHPVNKHDSAGLDYAGLDIGHLGAIYEKLLSYRLTRAPEDLAYDPKQDIFRPMRPGEQPEVTRADLYYQAEAGGRKAAGVFYTRREFVKHLLNHSLKPALEEHLERIQTLAKHNPNEAAQRLFDFSVVDPAMGSAHFLTAALDTMTDRIEIFLAHIAGLPAIHQQIDELREGGDTMGLVLEDGDLLRRLILKRCIYGVDLSPMAVEVANVTLWLASFVPGLALSYLGSNLKCGDALIGVANPNVVGESDSPLLTGEPVRAAMKSAAKLQRKLAQNPDRTPDEVKQSEQLAASLHTATSGLRRAFDLWTAEPLGVHSARHTLETNAAPLVEGGWEQNQDLANKVDAAKSTAKQYRFFHWPLEFPNIFHQDRPGFDVVVGNPPWNKVKFEMPSFLALHDPGIKGLRSGLERDERAERLFQQRPELRQEAEDIKRQILERRNFFRADNGYTIQGSGDTDLYKLFCERYSAIAAKGAFMGVVLPRVAFLGDGSRGFRRWFFRECRPSRVDALSNNRHWAFDIHPQFSIALVTAQVGVPVSGVLTTTGPARSEEEFIDYIESAGVDVDLSDLRAWTPAPASDSIREPTWELPLFPTPSHVSVLKKLRRWIRFDALPDPKKTKKNSRARAAPLRLFPYTEAHEAAQRALFTHPPGEGRIPVWKGRSFDQYDPHGNAPAGYWERDDVLEFVQRKRMGSSLFKSLFSEDILKDPSTHPIYRCRIAFRDVTNRTNSRTVIACLIPPETPLTHKAPYLVCSEWNVLAYSSSLAVMNSASFNWLARRYVEMNLSYFILNALTFPSLGDTDWDRISRLAAELSCVDERFAKFADEAGVDCGPLPEYQRIDKRAEIDALVAHAYALTADELRFIFTDFTQRAVPPSYRDLVIQKFESLS